MDVSQFSNRYRVQRLGENDIEKIYALCVGNELYYKFCPPFVTHQNIAEDMKALPPKKQATDKYYLGFFDGDKLIAVMDLIMGFPDEKTAFIGFFMTDASVQNAGIGSQIISGLCSALRDIGVVGIRLGWVKGNP